MEDGFCGIIAQADFGASTVAETPKSDGNLWSAGDGRKVGYYQDYNPRSRPCDEVEPDRVKWQGFTHFIWAFVSIDPSTFYLTPVDEKDMPGMFKFTALKRHGFPIWVSVGGRDFSMHDSSK